ncbi:hypothetical protein D3C78_1767600 [compost metagenome]
MVDLHDTALLHNGQNAGDAQKVVGGLRTAGPHAGQLAKLTQLSFDSIMQINPATTRERTEAQL